MSAEEWITWRTQHWRSVYWSNSKNVYPTADIFFGGYKTGTYSSAKSLIWVFENRPHTKQENMAFKVPVGDQHMLTFGFFVNRLRSDIKSDPEWNERRWAMAHKIMDTVEITPRPGMF